MKKNAKGNWASEFNFDDEENNYNDGQKSFKSEIFKESYEALNKFYQKENRKNKVTFKKGKPIWL
ncbi:MAG: hypothetical protein GX568_10655 [Candidatus Gastranaerophilales bacterium]|nr:hypothetical protein [Candidatus Gastranaerophilales bacterium]